MAADRWYYLRHPEGFSPDLFECVRSGWLTWKVHVEASIRHWEHLGLAGVAAPEYEWYEPELSNDRSTVTIPVGGEGTYGSFHTLEEAPPGEFRRYLPPWFHIELEVGRRDTCGWYPEVSWVPIIRPEERERYAQAFRRPQSVAHSGALARSSHSALGRLKGGGDV